MAEQHATEQSEVVCLSINTFARRTTMQTFLRLWASLRGLADAVDRITGLAHQGADMIEGRLPTPTQPPAISNVDSAGNKPKSRKAVIQ
jgi:hypothetical protein